MNTDHPFYEHVQYQVNIKNVIGFSFLKFTCIFTIHTMPIDCLTLQTAYVLQLYHKFPTSPLRVKLGCERINTVFSKNEIAH